MKKYIVLMLCLLSLSAVAQNRYEDLGNGTVLVHRDIPEESASSNAPNLKIDPSRHLSFKGISLNTSFRDFIKYLRAKKFYVYAPEESDICDITGMVCGIPNFGLTLVSSDEGKIYEVHACKSFASEKSMNAALETIVDKLPQAYPHYEDAAITLVDENRNMIDLWGLDVYDAQGYTLGSVCVFAQKPDGPDEYQITITYSDMANSLSSDALNYKLASYGESIDISEKVKPTLDACVMEVDNDFLKFTCRKGSEMYEMVAMGEDRGKILSCLYSGYTREDLQKKLMNAYFAQSLRVYNGNVLACTNKAFDGIHDKVIHDSFSAQKAQSYQPSTNDAIELSKKILDSNTNADMGWTLLEYYVKRMATRKSSSSSNRQKYHCNGLEFDNPADMENYKNAQGLK